jgi:hypothetical protein
VIKTLSGKWYCCNGCERPGSPVDPDPAAAWGGLRFNGWEIRGIEILCPGCLASVASVFTIDAAPGTPCPDLPVYVGRASE